MSEKFEEVISKYWKGEEIRTSKKDLKLLSQKELIEVLLESYDLIEGLESEIDRLNEQVCRYIDHEKNFCDWLDLPWYKKIFRCNKNGIWLEGSCPDALKEKKEQ